MFRASLVLTCVAFLMPPAASAQSNVLAEMYGRGVHSFNSGNYIDAERYLSMAIDGGSKDPRVYFFRGLVFEGSGRPSEARDDYREGARLETIQGASSTVGRALARVQGTRRMQIEAIRQEVRLEEMAKATSRARARYGDGADSPRATAPTRPVLPPPTAAEAATTEEDPFGDDPLAVGEASVASPDAIGDPLAEDVAAPAPAESASDDMFGAQPAAGDDDMFGAPPAGGADPFGADPFGGANDAMPAAGEDDADPFGAAPAPAGGMGVVPAGLDGGDAPAPAAQPTADPADTDGEDPFGAFDAMDDAPSADAPADNGDPFGAPAPAAQPAADPADTDGEDPFGAFDAMDDAPSADAPADNGDPFVADDEMNAQPAADDAGDPFADDDAMAPASAAADNADPSADDTMDMDDDPFAN